MRKVIVLEHISLDGVILAPGGPDEDTSGGFAYGGWQAPYSDDVLGTIPAAFKVTDSQVSPTGIIIVNYERSGAVTIGRL